MRIPGNALKEFAMPARHLPDSANLEQLKKQAKDLLKAYRTGDPDAHQVFADGHPRPIAQEAAKLTDAQLALSRSYGFDSWPFLRKAVAGRQLRSAIWDRNHESARQAIESEPTIIQEQGPHPRFGGQPAPIHIAVERGEAAIVKMLLDAGADPEDCPAGYGWTPLQLAAHWGHSDIVSLLLERGASIDIFAAALLGDTNSASALLAADPSLAKANGLNQAPPLHTTSTPEITSLLLDHGATLDTIDSFGNSPLASAIGRKCWLVADLLVERGAPADACMLASLGRSEALVDLVSATPDQVNFRGKIGLHSVVETPLHAASLYGHDDAVIFLLLKGADPNARASAGQTPLHLCTLEAIARRLVEAGADPAAIDDEHKTTPLAWAKISIDIHGASRERQKLITYLEKITPLPSNGRGTASTQSGPG
jgi:ankyrin repeat protein